MPNDERILETMPTGTLGLVATDSCIGLAQKVDAYLQGWREHREHQHANESAFKDYYKNSYIIKPSTPRFGSGEAKCVINQSVRGYDLYIMVDVTNYSLTYTVCGQTNHMSPDDHYADLKRVIAAAGGKARRITVIMPFLYESRQHRRTGRESLDCPLALQELINMGVDNIITFDAHDPRVVNAIPLNGFENVMPSYQFIKGILKNVKDITIDADHLMIISPAEGLIALAVKEKDNFEEVTVTAKVARKDKDGKRVKEVVDGKKVTVYDEVEKKIKKDSASRLHARRQMLKVLYTAKESDGTKKGTKTIDVTNKLFDEIAPKYADRNGGYTRIVKIGQRKGDGALEVLLELV